MQNTREGIPPARVDTVRFPAICAHRGLSGLLPESSMASFEAAVALGADEMEFDIRLTADKRLIICHDPKADRISTGEGKIAEMTLGQLRALQLISPIDRLPTQSVFAVPQEVFEAFGGRIVMNIHFKDLGADTAFAVGAMTGLARHYALEQSVYFATSEEETMRCFARQAPDIMHCALEPWREDLDIVDFALRYGCPRCQLFKGVFDREKVERALKAGLICNVFWADDEPTAREYLDMGISVLLTNRTDRLLELRDEYRRKQ